MCYPTIAFDRDAGDISGLKFGKAKIMRRIIGLISAWFA